MRKFYGGGPLITKAIGEPSLAVVQAIDLRFENIKEAIEMINIVNKYWCNYPYSIIAMKVVRNKRCFQINFDSNNEPNTGFGNEEEKDIIEKFVRKCSFFDFPSIENEEI